MNVRWNVRDEAVSVQLLNAVKHLPFSHSERCKVAFYNRSDIVLLVRCAKIPERNLDPFMCNPQLKCTILFQ